MMTNTQLKELAKLFNESRQQKDGKSRKFRGVTAGTLRANSFIKNPAVTPEMLMQYDAETGRKAESPESLLMIADKIAEGKVIESIPAPVEPQEGEALGMLESVLAKRITETYMPLITETVLEQIKDTMPKTKKVQIYESPKGKKVEGVFHQKFEEVMAWVQANEPVMLVGPAGTGKNVLCAQIAEVLDLDFYYSGAVKSEFKITGFIDANGLYQETAFYKAMKNGGIFMLDEVDASIPEVMVCLNAALANGYFDFPCGKVTAHENFRVVAGANTFGTGADYSYTGRYQLDAATLDRFAVIEIDYDKKIEECQTDDIELLDFIRAFRKAVKKCGIDMVVSTRSLKRIEKLKSTLPHKTLVKSALTKGLSRDDIRYIKSTMVIDSDNAWYNAL